MRSPDVLRDYSGHIRACQGARRDKLVEYLPFSRGFRADSRRDGQFHDIHVRPPAGPEEDCRGPLMDEHPETPRHLGPRDRAALSNGVSLV